MAWTAYIACLSGTLAFAFAQSPAAAQTEVAARSQAKGIQPDRDHPVLSIGAQAPDFSLPGVDGKVHTLTEYARTPILAIVFESNHCPVSMLYETRIKKIYEDYRNRGVTVVAINPNSPRAVRLDEMGYTDVPDSLEAMKIRAAYRHREWPYLYDGGTQATAARFGAVATPHIFVFDRNRTLQYQGRIDDNVNESLVKSRDARVAIEALLSGKPVPVQETKAFGCTTKWLTKATGVEQEQARIAAEPVKLTMATPPDVTTLRANGSGKILLVHFWTTACSSCVAQFADLQTTFWMYRNRSARYASLDFVSVSTNAPADQSAVLAFLQKQHAGNTNLQLSTTDVQSFQVAFGAKWNPATSFTAVITPDGTLVYQKEGKLDVLEMRRAILRHMPDVAAYPGQHDYWNEIPAKKTLR
jgi:thiol-disulfide isomerase/thioredoxin